MQGDDTADPPDFALANHRESINSATNELVFAREGVEEQIVTSAIVLNAGVPNGDGETA